MNKISDYRGPHKKVIAAFCNEFHDLRPLIEEHFRGKGLNPRICCHSSECKILSITDKELVAIVGTYRQIKDVREGSGFGTRIKAETTEIFFRYELPLEAQTNQQIS